MHEYDTPEYPKNFATLFNSAGCEGHSVTLKEGEYNVKKLREHRYVHLVTRSMRVPKELSVWIYREKVYNEYKNHELT